MSLLCRIADVAKRSSVRTMVVGSLVAGLAVASPLATGPTHGQVTAAATGSDGLIELTDEPSRGNLFDRAIEKSRGKEIGPRRGIPINRNGPFTFPRDTVEKKPGNDAWFGVDVSHYTDVDVPFETFARLKIKYVYCKATQGAGGKDGKFAVFWSRLGQLPRGRQVYRGAYHFLTAADDGDAQAQTFLKVLGENGGLQESDMPPVVDLEWDVTGTNGTDRWADQNPDAIIQSTLKWLQRVEKSTGRVPVLYTARSWWLERIGSEQKFAAFSRYSLWIADYSKSSRAVEIPTVPNGAKWALWQFTNSAKLATKFSAGLDASVFKDSEEHFYQQFGVKPFK
jgi:lysozyme